MAQVQIPIDETEPGTTTKVVKHGGQKVLRTTVISDETLAEVQQEINELDKAIARALTRAVAPMETRKTALEAKIAQLQP